MSNLAKGNEFRDLVKPLIGVWPHSHQAKEF